MPPQLDLVVERGYSSVKSCSEDDDEVLPPLSSSSPVHDANNYHEDLETGGGDDDDDGAAADTTTAPASAVGLLSPTTATNSIPTRWLWSSSWWWRDYMISYHHQVLELLTCLTCFILTNIMPKSLSLVSLFGILPTTPHQRPLPYMTLDGVVSGDNYYYIRNLSYNEVYNVDEETVPFPLLIALSAILPLALQLFLSIITSSCCCMSKTRRFVGLSHQNNKIMTTTTTQQQLHNTLCVYLTAWSLNMLATEFVKNYVGYLRPVFYDLCQPTADYSTCQNNDHHGMRKSFPSGHAATAFCGLTLLTMYIHTQWGVASKKKRWYMRRQQQQQQQQQQSPHERFATTTTATTTEPEKQRYQDDSSSYENFVYDDYDYVVLEYDSCRDGASMVWARLISIFALLPMVVALWIAASRVRDNRHFPADIIAGGLIGFGIAIYSHGLWFVDG